MAETSERGTWLLGAASFLFTLLQSLCTAVMAISGVRMVIGLGALAAAAGVKGPVTGWHADAIRVPMLAVAVLGSVVNLYVIWRRRSLRARPAAQWRARPVPPGQRRGENFQIALAVVTLLLVAFEWAAHRVVHPAA